LLLYAINAATIAIFGYLCNVRKTIGKKIFLIYATIQLTLLCGLRHYSVGIDTKNYINIYFETIKRVPLDKNFFVRYNRETGYYLFTKIVSLFTDNYTWLLLIISIIIISLVSITVYKYSADPVLSIFVFITLRPYAFMFTGIRQSIALGICFFSYTIV